MNHFLFTENPIVTIIFLSFHLNLNSSYNYLIPALFEIPTGYSLETQVHVPLSADDNI
jgi:hypothetical protein